MMARRDEVQPADLDDTVADVYAGPLDEFVQRRDAAAKALRAAGRREDANAIKALRKPSRTAWALDAAATDGSGVLDALDAAIVATLEAQAGSGDVRQAFADLRQAVRAFGARAAVIAMSAGHRLDESDLSNAVLAVIARPDDFDALRRGRLVEVPEAGGLDFLSALPLLSAPVRAAAPPQRAASAPAAEAAPAARPSKAKRSAAEKAAEKARKAAEEALRKAQVEVEEARARMADAEHALEDVASALEEAEERLRAAERDVRTLRGERERAQQNADKVAATLAKAEDALRAARAAADAAGASSS